MGTKVIGHQAFVLAKAQLEQLVERHETATLALAELRRAADDEAAFDIAMQLAKAADLASTRAGQIMTWCRRIDQPAYFRKGTYEQAHNALTRLRYAAGCISSPIPKVKALPLDDPGTIAKTALEELRSLANS